jgi:acetate kinase
MHVLVLNCGSSSIKYQLFEMPGEVVAARGSIERVGTAQARLTHRVGDEERILEQPVPSYQAGMELMLSALGELEHVDAVGHRIVHGGDLFADAVVVTPEVLARLETITPLAPLHHPPNLAGIAACRAALPHCPHVCVFDNGLHRTLPPEAYTYALPHELCRKHRIRRYGFHGLAFRSAFERAEALLGVDIATLRVVTLMLGSGNTANALKHGASVEVSTGFTPHEGLVQSTRAGDLDAAVVPFLMEHEGLSAEQVTELLNKKSGWFGVSGVSQDLRDVIAAADAGDEQAALALGVHAHRARKYVGAYAAAMGGIDLLIFTGSVGERAASVRASIARNLGFMGLHLDQSANAALSGEGIISTPASRAKIIVTTVNEEIVIARDVVGAVAGEGV